MDSQKLTKEIALLERQLKQTKNETLKNSITKKITRLKNDLEGTKMSTSELAKKLLSAKQKVQKLTASDFNEVIRRLSKKPEYHFLKHLTKQEIKDDLKRTAKPVGYRFKGEHNYRKPTKQEVIDGKKDGTVYYENRSNRADVSRTVQLAKGSTIKNTQQSSDPAASFQIAVGKTMIENGKPYKIESIENVRGNKTVILTLKNPYVPTQVKKQKYIPSVMQRFVQGEVIHYYFIDEFTKDENKHLRNYPEIKKAGGNIPNNYEVGEEKTQQHGSSSQPYFHTPISFEGKHIADIVTSGKKTSYSIWDVRGTDFKYEIGKKYSSLSSALKAISNYRSKFEHGGNIPDNYRGKTPAQVWDAWTNDQRRHFFEDHVSSNYPPSAANQTWDELEETEKDFIAEHVMRGQYKTGGNIKKEFHYHSDILSKWDELNNITEDIKTFIEQAAYTSGEELRNDVVDAIMNGIKKASQKNDPIGKAFDEKVGGKRASQKKNTFTAKKTETAVFIDYVKPNWVKGKFGDYTFTANVFDSPSQYGINNGRVSKLFIQEEKKRVAEYDRGNEWFASKEVQKAYNRIVSELEKYEQPFKAGGVITVSTDAYKSAYKKQPKGMGMWFFEVAGKNITPGKSMDYKFALKWAKKEAQKMNVNHVKVLN